MKQSILSCVVAFLLTACGGKKEEKENVPKTDFSEISQTVSLSVQQRSSAGIEVGLPQYENISNTIALQGMVDAPPQNTVKLSFPLGGYIRSTNLLPGKSVKKGQVLAYIEDMQFIQLQQDYLTAKTNFAFYEKEYERQRYLNSSKASSDKVFQQAKADMDKENILISSLAEKLKLLGIDPNNLTPGNIRKEVPVLSPINGFVSKINISIGKYTSPTDILFELIDPSDLHLSLKVFEKDLPKIAVGEKVYAWSNNNPEKKYAAKVFLINRTFDENRSTEIHCHFDKYAAELVPGMFMNGDVAVQDVKSLVVPEEAVVRWANKHYVFVEKENGDFTMTEVIPGVLNGARQQIESKNITTDTKLVLKNAFSLLMKLMNAEEEG
ncbi:efflux RND transporter periplasmic adaptor subunit [Pseudobacter ginsenosidimutans]|uniref:Cobalt-zinc-cadmium efflux system membrane fusion protein n=1 Tax=Pseudobacter ginsenosidimutans TaxID=661488 RepID=A0A4Q7MVI4_9BACT|nr:efflux RND transporter periplasmic adaptor subunit [Pseudobacter ginsenosidimutans]QEC42072.1 efflux RND transporter periplasmic adaptor subunit [Pseudobacter ginsenosidimutans]RZS71090.1 cobalt-zinc-cadmium efflux system membrane fusion protein [Pseudobacter ginsenosidimutans]